MQSFRKNPMRVLRLALSVTVFLFALSSAAQAQVVLGNHLKCSKITDKRTDIVVPDFDLRDAFGLEPGCQLKPEKAKWLCREADSSLLG
jgi:hypothetical protein